MVGPRVTSRPAGTTSGLSVSPTGQNFGTKYQATFYAWSNFNGAPNANVTVWDEVLTGLSTNTNYFFSAWVASSYPTNPAQPDFISAKNLHDIKLSGSGTIQGS